MSKIQPQETSLVPAKLSPSVVLDAQTDIRLHIKTVLELIIVLLDQLDVLEKDATSTDGGSCVNLRDAVRRFEIDLIQRALAQTRGSQVQAAKLLGVNATTLHEKMNRYGLRYPHGFYYVPPGATTRSENHL